ncbi:MAG: DUF5681 domain-containing protein [Marinovum algicola]
MTDEDYDVGYGKPPLHSRFKPGQSGNPRGRPKGVANFKTDVAETLKAPVPVKTNGRTRTVSTQRALLLRLREKALKGDRHALDFLLTLAQAQSGDALAAEAVPLTPDDAAILDDLVARRQRAATRAAEAEQNGKGDDDVEPE